MLQSGAVYGLHGRLVLALKDFDGWRLVALDRNGRPTIGLAFDFDDRVVAGEIVATALVRNGDDFQPSGIATIDVDRLELVADSRKTLFAPLSKDLVAVWDI